MSQVYKKRILLVLLFLAISIVLYKIGIKKYLNMAYIKSHEQALIKYISNHYALAALLYSMLYALCVFFMISITLFITVLAGYFFGTITATILSVIGALTGGILLFVTIRLFFKNLLIKHYEASIHAFKEQFNYHGIRYLLALHLFPLTPYAFIVVIAALSDVSLTTFICTTLLGILPITFLCAYAGQKLVTLTALHDILSLPLIIILAIFSLIIVLPALQSLFHKKKDTSPADTKMKSDDTAV